MACYHPMPAYRGEDGSVKLWPPLGRENLSLPCGKCIGCRTDRATMWARRCSHEASLWPHNVFVTLTYDDDHLPKDGQLVPKDLSLFIKRLRKYVDGNGGGVDRSGGGRIRFFACGEYGERSERPHYHALFFNLGFTSGYQVGKDLFESPVLHRLWTYGAHKYGVATPAAASYIAQYNLKKIGSGGFDSDGVERPAPFLRMSLRPAIGSGWLDGYREDLKMGYLVVDGRRVAIPRAYLEKLKVRDPPLYEEIVGRKAAHQLSIPSELSSPERLAASEIIHKRLKSLTESRSL